MGYFCLRRGSNVISVYLECSLLMADSSSDCGLTVASLVLSYSLMCGCFGGAAGQLVFHGPREEVVPFFASCGFHCPPRKAIPDFLQELTSRKDQQVCKP